MMVEAMSLGVVVTKMAAAGSASAVMRGVIASGLAPLLSLVMLLQYSEVHVFFTFDTDLCLF